MTDVDNGLGAASPSLEFSRLVEIAELKGRRTEIDLDADADERTALARRFDVARIDNLHAHVVLTPFASGNKVAMAAQFAAEVEQTCVVTLEPLTNRIEGHFATEFVPSAFVEGGNDIEFSIDEDDPPEPIVDGKMEIGELVAQHLGLSIDPFPRAPGVVFDGYGTGDDGGTDAGAGAKASPFAVLERLKTRKN